MTIHDLTTNHRDTPDHHHQTHLALCHLTNSDPQLKTHRDWVELHTFGFGERSFQAMWKMLLAEMPENFSFLEIGVFKGQIISLMRMLRPDANIYGVTPLSSEGGVWESDYKKDIETIHDHFNLKKSYHIFKGLSTDPQIIDDVKLSIVNCPLSILYIDGGHTFEIAKSDIINYAPLIKPGGYLVIDDCCNDMQIPFGMFGGIQTVTDAVRDTLPNMKDFKFLFSVVHIKVYQRL